MATIRKHQVDLYQGDDDESRKFGYVAGDTGDGGFFFTWHDTLEATIASVEEDQIDGDGGLDSSDVAAFLAHYLPRTKRGRKLWESDPAEVS